MTTKLSINLNKVALIRNSRDTSIPDVVEAAKTVIAAGADGITVHPRPDQRHIRPQDVYDLAELLSDKAYENIEFNIEGNPFAGPEDNGFPGFMALVSDVMPHQCTLVPDDPVQLTSDHGWNLLSEMNRLQPVVDQLKGQSIRVSAFMDPDVNQIQLSSRLGVDRIELYTGPFADAYGSSNQEAAFSPFQSAAETAADLGLGLNAGHDLNLENLAYFCQVRELAEVSIGHAVISDALWLGLHEVVSRYRQILDLHS